MITEYAVSGMSCEHCVNRVSGELNRLPGVTEVSIDLPSGTVTVTSESPLTRNDVALAIDEAGYDLVDA